MTAIKGERLLCFMVVDDDDRNKGVLMLGSGLVLLFVLNWSLSLIVLASAPVMALITGLLSRRNERITASALDAQAVATSCSEECLRCESLVFCSVFVLLADFCVSAESTLLPPVE